MLPQNKALDCKVLDHETIADCGRSAPGGIGILKAGNIRSIRGTRVPCNYIPPSLFDGRKPSLESTPQPLLARGHRQQSQIWDLGSFPPPLCS